MRPCPRTCTAPLTQSFCSSAPTSSPASRDLPFISQVCAHFLPTPVHLSCSMTAAPTPPSPPFLQPSALVERATEQGLCAWHLVSTCVQISVLGLLCRERQAASETLTCRLMSTWRGGAGDINYRARLGAPGRKDIPENTEPTLRPAGGAAITERKTVFQAGSS